MDCSISALDSVFRAKQEQAYAQIGIAVLSKSLEATQIGGEAAVELLEAATEIARQLGRGLQFDARA